MTLTGLHPRKLFAGTKHGTACRHPRELDASTNRSPFIGAERRATYRGRLRGLRWRGEAPTPGVGSAPFGAARQDVCGRVTNPEAQRMRQRCWKRPPPPPRRTQDGPGILRTLLRVAALASGKSCYSSGATEIPVARTEPFQN